MTCIWITGLPAAGKTTLARALAKEVGGVVIDGDAIRLPGQGFDTTLAKAFIAALGRPVVLGTGE